MNAVDTNVLVYAYDDSTPRKRDAARALLESMADAVLLWQVACEFIAASRKTLGPTNDLGLAWDRLREIQAVFPLVCPTPGVLDLAKDIQSRGQVQFWDALIYAAAKEAGVTRIFSEDLPGSVIDGVEIVNPFGG